MLTSYHQNLEHIFDSQTLSTNEIEKPGEQDIHLWLVPGNIYKDLKNYRNFLLSENEQKRAKKFRFRKDHDLFVIGRCITKILLAYYTDRSPESVKIIPDSFGKPTCEMNLFFNISHSDDQLLLGFSNSEIGVDIERIDSTVDTEGISKSHFSEIELQKMMTCPSDKRAETFFEIWTKKESLIKGIGKGLSIPLQNFNVTHQNGKVLWKFSNEKNYGNWYVRNIETKQGFKAASATQKEIFKLNYFCHDTDGWRCYKS